MQCYPLVLLIELSPVCMKYTAQGDSWVANMALGEAECYICQILYKQSGSALSVLLWRSINKIQFFEI